MIPVKICGITSYDDAKIAVSCGASAIGMIFYQASPRYIHPHKLKEWIFRISDSVKKVGVFVNEKQKNIEIIVKELNLDYIQLHGNESPEYCNQMIRPVIKVFRVGDAFKLDVLDNFNVKAFLFDTYQKGKHGGTGEIFSWDIISSLNSKTPVILSGGINLNNIINGIKIVKPSAIDVNSGVELSPGVKDKGKLEKLFNLIKNSNYSNQSHCVFNKELE